MTSSRRPEPSPPSNPFVPEVDAPQAPTPSRRARQLLQLAHQAVYRLPATYGGFTATVFAHSGAWTVRGAVDVHCPHGAVFQLDPHDPGHDESQVANGGPGPSAATVTTVTAGRRPLDDGRWLPRGIRDTRRTEASADAVHEHRDEFGAIDGFLLPLRRVASDPDLAAIGPVTIELSDHRPPTLADGCWGPKVAGS